MCWENPKLENPEQGILSRIEQENGYTGEDGYVTSRRLYGCGNEQRLTRAKMAAAVSGGSDEDEEE